MVIVFASASGLRGGRFEQETRVARVFGGLLRGEERTAIELTTAAGVVGVLELLREGKLPRSGFVGQEQVPCGRKDAQPLPCRPRLRGWHGCLLA